MIRRIFKYSIADVLLVVLYFIWGLLIYFNKIYKQICILYKVIIWCLLNILLCISTSTEKNCQLEWVQK